jgi:hypothetical protein
MCSVQVSILVWINCFYECPPPESSASPNLENILILAHVPFSKVF